MVETERLKIIPLNFNQLQKFIENDSSLEQELGLTLNSREISTELKDALEHEIMPLVSSDEDNYLYYTVWSIVLKSENKIIGDLCFKGKPDADGNIEIGYGTYEEFRGNGFMTEAVGGMIKWANNRKNLKAIIAKTEKENLVSAAVLQKNQFIKTGESDDLYLWAKEL